jgi:hypothetical protein
MLSAGEIRIYLAAGSPTCARGSIRWRRRCRLQRPRGRHWLTSVGGECYAFDERAGGFQHFHVVGAFEGARQIGDALAVELRHFWMQGRVSHIARPHAPWFVVPADHKWYARLVVSETILAALEKIDPKAPEVTDTQRDAIRKARAALGAKHG